MTHLLAPSERLAGTPEQRRSLAATLSAMRATPALHAARPGLHCVVMADLLTSRPAYLDLTLLHAGTEIAGRRLRDLGVPKLLPAERVWIGTASADPLAFGGFHFPDQGYRHWQMAAIITRHGNLSHQGHDDPSVATLDLLRAYAHDSLHYASYRIYQWAATSGGPQMTRTRYGINFRRADGRTYSAPDPADSPTTRNLGIIMEGATDREARLITHTTADLASIRSPATAPDSLTYRDITGQLTATDLTAPALATPARAIYRAFLARMASYQRTVGSRYESFLRDASPDAPDELHDLILTAMISGTLTHLSQRLNNRYGPAAFTRTFKSATFTGQARAA